jgi:hypothetical protein
MLLTTDFDKDFVNEEYVTVTSVFSFQPVGIGDVYMYSSADCTNSVSLLAGTMWGVLTLKQALDLTIIIDINIVGGWHPG